MTGAPRVEALKKMGRVVVPGRLRPRARRLAVRYGLASAPRTPEDEPFEYPFWEILGHEHSFYPQYLWGTMCAALLAATLGYKRTTVIEFGVAGGNGLVELERIAGWVERRAGVEISVLGFDTGVGLPPPQDYRDLPNLWREGDFSMDAERLRARLSRAELLLGPVAETVPSFIAGDPAPVGFVSFDLDMYSSTVDAFGIFDHNDQILLPRVVCYFDDIIGFSHSDYSGERLAISEFNDAHDVRKISKIYGLRYVLNQDRWWTDMMYMLHSFRHPRYNDPDGTNRLRELPLGQR